MRAIHDPAGFPFVPALEAAFPAVRDELLRLAPEAFAASPDSLTTAADGYDERGWRWFGLFGADPGLAAHRARCPVAAAACAMVPGLVNAGFSWFVPGTHLYPHCGELSGVLRCHLPLLVPAGDVGLRFGDDVHRWQPGRCVVFDDRVEHEAWNHGDGVRVVLLVTFRWPAAG